MTDQEMLETCIKIVKAHKPDKFNLTGYEDDEKFEIRAEWNGEEIARDIILQQLYALRSSDE